MARLLERALRSEGHSVKFAFDGEQPIVCSRSQGIDVILLDITFPIMDGFAVLSLLRSERFTTPVIMLTAQ